MTIWNFDWSQFWTTAASMSWCEILMLVCFGASWPSSIHKMLITRNSTGKSTLFLILVMIGYLFGVAHKLFFSLDVVILLYILLFFIVMVDLVICFHYRHESSLGLEKVEKGTKR